MGGRAVEGTGLVRTLAQRASSGETNPAQPVLCRDQNRQQSGWVAERLKAPVLKTGRGASSSWVRIPPHPPASPVRACVAMKLYRGKGTYDWIR